MTIIKTYCLIILVILSTSSFAQKKKEIKNLGVKTITITDTRKEKTTNDIITSYNNQGEITEEINYDKEGNLKSTTKYKYNPSGDVIEECEYDGKNELKEKKQIKYNQKNKIEELITDKDDKILKKIVYSYNNNGLKKERKTYDSLNTLISNKQYNYEYKKTKK